MSQSSKVARREDRSDNLTLQGKTKPKVVLLRVIPCIGKVERTVVKRNEKLTDGKVLVPTLCKL